MNALREAEIASKSAVFGDRFKRVIQSILAILQSGDFSWNKGNVYRTARSK